MARQETRIRRKTHDWVMKWTSPPGMRLTKENKQGVPLSGKYNIDTRELTIKSNGKLLCTMGSPVYQFFLRPRGEFKNQNPEAVGCPHTSRCPQGSCEGCTGHNRVV